MKYEVFIHLPMKMEPRVSSETSAIRTQTPGNYPKRNKLHVGHVFTKPVHIEGTTQKFLFSNKLFFIVVHISAARRCACM